MARGMDSIGLFDGLLFPKIFQTFRMAIQPTKLIIAFLAVATICLAGWLMDFSGTVVTDESGNVTELSQFMHPNGPIESHIAKFKDSGKRKGVFSTLWHFGSDKFHKALRELFDFNFTSVGDNISDCFRALTWAFRYHYIYCLIFVTIVLAVMSVAGGALCRIAALQFAQGERPGLTESLRFSIGRFTSFFTAPLAPIGIIAFMGFFIFLLGLLGNIPRAGELIVGLGMPWVLLLGSLTAVIAVGAVVGFGLMFPAVAYDGSDCFDSISRSFSYVYAQPARMAFYTVIAAVYGAICYIVIRFFVFLMLWITHCFLRLGIWTDGSTEGVNKLTAIWPRPELMNLLGSSDPVTANWTELWASCLVYFFALVVIGLMVSFIISFYFCANTVIYSLMRNRVDRTALDDICTHFAEAEADVSSENA
ncbi:MAG: hypothetical protein JSW59_08010 [Phycisphaerales bacterium]|nr:MAG: hypothetical protein JSW59_08010 [Phycisphaerales bacterium]